MTDHSQEQVRDSNGHFGVDWRTYVDKGLGELEKDIEREQREREKSAAAAKEAASERISDNKDYIAEVSRLNKEAIDLAAEGIHNLLEGFPAMYALKPDLASLATIVASIKESMVGKVEHGRVRDDLQELKEASVDPGSFQALCEKVDDLKSRLDVQGGTASQTDVQIVAARAARSQTIAIASVLATLFIGGLTIVVLLLNK